MRNLVKATIFYMASITAAMASACPEQLYQGADPVVIQSMQRKTRELCFSEFSVMHSGLTRTPLFTAEHITKDRSIASRQQHRRDSLESFHEEPNLPGDEKSWLSDYTRSGYDRGHMAPNGDMTDPVSQGESFTLANMIPQAPRNNRGIWAAIEIAVRDIAIERGEVWVVTVPMFAGAQTTWLHNRVAIPSQIAKAVFIPGVGAGAYLTPNDESGTWSIITISSLKKMSGIDVFPTLTDNIKDMLIDLPVPSTKNIHYN